LLKYSIEYIPEAHCYLEYRGARIDLTHYNLDPGEQITEFFIEKQIAPDDIGEMKQKFHKDFLRQHYGKDRLNNIWHVREKCISALSA